MLAMECNSLDSRRQPTPPTMPRYPAESWIVRCCARLSGGFRPAYLDCIGACAPLFASQAAGACRAKLAGCVRLKRVHVPLGKVARCFGFTAFDGGF